MNVVLMNEDQAAQVLTVGTKTLQSWRVRGVGPRWVRIGRLVRYTEGELMKYIEEQTRQSTSEASHGHA
jgi:hypothetical protein